MRINTNITALNTYNSYTAANNKIASSVAKLSSGYAINSAADNAAGLAISEKMRAQIRGLDKASSNSQTAISLAQTAEGSLESSGEILQRMREISVQSSSDTNQDNIDREALQAEFSQLNSELDEIAQDSTFNNQHLLNGNLSSKNVTSTITTTASGLTTTVGNANSGIYQFTVGVEEVTPGVTAAAPDSATVAASSLNSKYFSAGTATMGVDAKASSLLNGNYTLSAKANYADDKTTVSSITFTATGDNDQSFSVTKKASDLASIATAGTLDIDFGSTAFKATLTAANDLTSGNPTSAELLSLASGVSGTITVSGGKDAVAQENAVVAHLTGASDVKLKAGMSSVTFDNGVTVNFDKLTAANLDTTASTVAIAGKDYTNGVNTFAQTVAGDDSTAAAFTLDLTNLASDFDGTMSFTFLGHTYSGVAVSDGDDVDDIGAALLTKIKAGSDITVGSTTVTASSGVSYSGGKLTFTANATGAATLTTDLAAASVTTSGTKTDPSFSFESVFGTATGGVSTSTVTVASTSNSGLTIQVGANTGDEMEINIDRADAEYLGVKGLDVSTQASASKAVDVVNKAINQVSSQRAYLGAVQNRLTYKIDNLTTSSQNLTSAESSIRDVDMASEMTKFTNSQILSQASTAMLAQANALPQNVLSLLK